MSTMHATPLFKRIAGLSLRNKIRLVWFTLVTIFMGWLIASYQVRGVSEAIMTSDRQVLVQDTEEAITFSPVKNPYPLTFIFYPCAVVAAKSYAPFARAIALQGYTTIIVKMPFRMASLGHEKALEIRNNGYWADIPWELPKLPSLPMKTPDCYMG